MSSSPSPQNFLRQPRWSPYLVGAGIGILSWTVGPWRDTAGNTGYTLGEAPAIQFDTLTPEVKSLQVLGDSSDQRFKAGETLEAHVVFSEDMLVNGQPMRSCVLPTASLGNKPIRTLDGLEKNGQLHPVQAAFVEEQAAQCGYCANGWVMHAVALLEKNPKATDAQIQQGLANVQCRCGTQIAILRAVKKARDNMATAKA